MQKYNHPSEGYLPLQLACFFLKNNAADLTAKLLEKLKARFLDPFWGCIKAVLLVFSSHGLQLNRLLSVFGILCDDAFFLDQIRENFFKFHAGAYEAVSLDFLAFFMGIVLLILFASLCFKKLGVFKVHVSQELFKRHFKHF